MQPEKDKIMAKTFDTVRSFADHLSKWAAVLAVALSATSFYLSYNAGRIQERHALRTELSDTLDRLITSQLDYSELYRDVMSNPDQGSAAYLQSVSTIYTQQNNTLLERAMILADEIPELVTWTDYVTIAQSNFNVSDVLRAELYYQRAIDNADSDLHKVFALRGFATFLFQMNRVDEARQYYQEAADLARQLTDQGQEIIHMTTGYTYQGWALAEAAKGNDAEASDLVARACTEYGSLTDQTARRNSIQSLDQAWRQLQVMVSASPILPDDKSLCA
jgi:tetratricopeptide (TPR) repeat protein